MTPHPHRASPLAILAIAVLVTLSSGCGPERAAAPGGPDSPDEQMVFAMSKVHIAHDKHEPGESLALALQVMREIRGGASVGDVSRRMSDDPVIAERDGWLGFLEPRGEDSLSLVMQALPIGQVSGPVGGPKGFDVYYRHTLAEAREIEQGRVIPMDGFVVPYSDDPEARMPGKEEARAIAEEAENAIRGGELGMAEAIRKYRPRRSREEAARFQFAQRGTETDGLFRSLEKVAPGELAPVAELEGAFGVFQRRPYLRTLVRHILIEFGEKQGESGEVKLVRPREEAKQLAEDALARVKPDGSNWDAVLRQYTDEKFRIPTGGLLGCIGNGDLIPDLEDAIRETPRGKILDRTVESPGGFHIIWRVD